MAPSVVPFYHQSFLSQPLLMAQVLSFDFLALHHIYYSEIMLLFYGDFVVQNTVFLQYFLRHVLL